MSVVPSHVVCDMPGCEVTKLEGTNQVGWVRVSYPNTTTHSYDFCGNLHLFTFFQLAVERSVEKARQATVTTASEPESTQVVITARKGRSWNKTSDEKIEQIKTLHRKGKTPAYIITATGVSNATVYNYIKQFNAEMN